MVSFSDAHKVHARYLAPKLRHSTVSLAHWHLGQRFVTATYAFGGMHGTCSTERTGGALASAGVASHDPCT